MSFEEHECYCKFTVDETTNKITGGTTTEEYIGDGVWKCPACGYEDSEHKDEIYKARVEVKKVNGYLEAIVIEPFNEKLLSHMTDTGGNETSELEKDCLEEFLNDSCYDPLRGHEEGVFDMEILFYDYATGGDGGEREVVIEVCKETPVTSIVTGQKIGDKNE